MKIPTLPDRPPPEHPYRDSAIIYGVMAAVGFGFLLLTGQKLWIAAVAMIAFFLVAIVWNWWRFRSQVDEQDTSR